MDTDNESLIILLVIIALALAPIIIEINKGFIDFKNTIINFTQTHTFYIILMVLFFILIFIGYCISYIKIKNRIKEKRHRKDDIKHNNWVIRDYLEKNYKKMNSEQLQKYIKEGKQIKSRITGYNELSEEYKKVKARIHNSESYIEFLEIEHKKNRALSEESESKERIEKLDKEERMKSLLVNEKDRSIMRDLEFDIQDISVLKKEELTKDNIQTLIRRGYVQVNEYCVYEQKVISVLVCPPLNHSPTHTFLVWSVKKLLKTFDEIKSIRSYETKSADVTFKYKNKYYAIEIETGKSLRNKKRMQEKVNFLESKFQDRWFFIVSNRDLLPKYRKLGTSVQRKEVAKMIEKMLENRHPKKAGVN